MIKPKDEFKIEGQKFWYIASPDHKPLRVTITGATIKISPKGHAVWYVAYITRRGDRVQFLAPADQLYRLRPGRSRTYKAY